MRVLGKYIALADVRAIDLLRGDRFIPPAAMLSADVRTVHRWERVSNENPELPDAIAIRFADGSGTSVAPGFVFPLVLRPLVTS